ncbi:hypothetical protein [Pelagerythrobacter marinus]|uniref:hypothetical protein n=1 Tax=Pelagerythrobacter marinus TaxID=538382 RepID=UPI002AC95B2D|nr:hypothetical protein [Pelagerythrobacter marinus]WPZ05656.1 hypothetical protein T8T98_09460 [Pelagerythrobacter marinus]
MLYTIGHRENYERFFREQRQPMKLGRGPHPRNPGEEYPGGSIYLTREEAEAAAPDGYTSYGVETTIENTYLVGADRHLIETSPLVRLP